MVPSAQPKSSSIGPFQDRMIHESSVVTTASDTAAIGQGSGAFFRPADVFSMLVLVDGRARAVRRDPRYPVVSCRPGMRIGGAVLAQRRASRRTTRPRS